MSSTGSRSLLVFFVATSLPCLGQPTWRAVVGALGDEEGVRVRATNVGNAVVVGNTGSFGNGSSDAYVLMLDGNGALIWSTVFGGPQIDRATGLCIDEDGSLLISGFTNGGGLGGYDGWLLKADPSGNLLWQRYYGGPAWDFFHSIEPAGDGGWLLAGSTASEGVGAGDGWLVRTDAEGEVQFSAVFGSYGEDEFRSAVKTADGGLVAAGTRDLGTGDSDAWVVKLHDDNSLEWEQLIGGVGVEEGRDVLETLGGGFSVVGNTGSVSQYVQHLHFKLNSAGDSLWSSFGGGDVNDQEAFDHVQTSSGDFAIVGYTKTTGGGGKDIYVQTSTADGAFIVGHTFGLTEDDIGHSISETTDGFFVCGSFGSTPEVGAGNKDVFVIRCDSVVDTDTEYMTSILDPTDIITRVQKGHGTLFPNPASGSCRLPTQQRLAYAHLFDTQGRLVRSWPAPVPQDLDLYGLRDGSYLLVAETEDRLRRSQPLIIAGN